MVCRSRLPGVLVAVGVTASGAWADAAPPRTGALEVGTFGGYTLLSKDNQLGNAPDPSMRPGSGSMTGARTSYHLSELLALEAEADCTFGTFANSGRAASVVGWRGSVLWHFSNAWLRPFALLGADGTSTVWRERGTEHDSDVTGHVAAGVKADVTDRLSVRADARYFVMDGTESRLSHNFAFGLGLSFRMDANVADADGDGVPNHQDRCRQQAEDRDGFEDADGCPDDDNDDDGIADAKDKCANARETLNGQEDEDGCPDGAETVVVTRQSLKIMQKVAFSPGGAVIQAESFKLLDTVAVALGQHPRLTKVAVEGHTEELLLAEDNQKLSLLRAEAVLNYLVDKGIAVRRLVAEGFGWSQPLCGDLEQWLQNEGKGKPPAMCQESNRRVQFRVIEVDGKALAAGMTTAPAAGPLACQDIDECKAGAAACAE